MTLESRKKLSEGQLQPDPLTSSASGIVPLCGPIWKQESWLFKISLSVNRQSLAISCVCVCVCVCVISCISQHSFDQNHSRRGVGMIC